MSNFPDEWIEFVDGGGGAQASITKAGPVGGSGANLTSVTLVVTELWYKVRIYTAGAAGVFGSFINLIDLNTSAVLFSTVVDVDTAPVSNFTDVFNVQIPISPGWGVTWQFAGAGVVNVAQSLRMKGYAI